MRARILVAVVACAAIFAVSGCGGASGNGAPSRTDAAELLRDQLGKDTLTTADYGGGEPLADFSLDEVTGIRNQDANTLAVEFRFHWTLRPGAKAKLAQISGCDKFWSHLQERRWCLPLDYPQPATAIFVKYDDGWRLKKVQA